MCTLSWTIEKKGYRLFFNRDEQRSRPAAEPPRVWEEPEGTFIGPRDPVGGGTWIGVNAAGWTTAVLNHYEAGTEPVAGRLSRGGLVRRFAPLGAVEVAAVLAAAELAAYAPFHLVRVDPAGRGRRTTWDGRVLTTHDRLEACLPLTTSSVQTERVTARRRSIFGSLTAMGSASAETLAMFHRHFDPSDGAASVCMRRDDAQTVSLCEVVVGPRTVRLCYYPRAVEQGGFGAPVACELARSGKA